MFLSQIWMVKTSSNVDPSDKVDSKFPQATYIVLLCHNHEANVQVADAPCSTPSNAARSSLEM